MFPPGSPARAALRVIPIGALIALGSTVDLGRASQPDPIASAVASPERPPADRERDVDRKPAEVLRFFGIRPGMRVADCMTGAGYYAELLARVVGTEGRVYALNNPRIADVFDKALDERLARPGLERVTKLTRELEDPGLPADLDAVLLVRFYHDFFWLRVDRMDFNKAVFTALKPGGVFGVIDHQAAAGSGSRDVRLHRIDLELVKREISAAGFVLEEESDMLRHPEDTLDWSISADQSRRRDQTDRFVLRFRKPAPGATPGDGREPPREGFGTPSAGGDPENP